MFHSASTRGRDFSRHFLAPKAELFQGNLIVNLSSRCGVLNLHSDTFLILYFLIKYSIKSIFVGWNNSLRYSLGSSIVNLSAKSHFGRCFYIGISDRKRIRKFWLHLALLNNDRTRDFVLIPGQSVNPPPIPRCWWCLGTTSWWCRDPLHAKRVCTTFRIRDFECVGRSEDNFDEIFLLHSLE